MGETEEGERKTREGRGRRIQLKKNDITCAAREEEREREREWRGWSESEQGETALDGLEQMWMKERGRDGQEERTRKTEIERKEREHLH